MIELTAMRRKLVSFWFGEYLCQVAILRLGN
jgi:hypothetical protein